MMKTPTMIKTYKTIKWVLRKQIENQSNTFWTWKQGEDENFTCIYKAYNNDLPIYTPHQLLELINKI